MMTNTQKPDLKEIAQNLSSKFPGPWKIKQENQKILLCNPFMNFHSLQSACPQIRQVANPDLNGLDAVVQEGPMGPFKYRICVRPSR